MNDLAAFRSYLVVVLHDHWATLLVVAILIAAVGGVAAATDSDTGGERADVVGTLELHVTGVPDRAQTADGLVIIPDDGVLPVGAIDHLAVVASLEPERPSSLDGEASIEVNITVSRESRLGTLWTVDRYAVNDTLSPPGGVRTQIDPARLLVDAQAIDNELETSGGQLVIGIDASAALSHDGRYTASVPITHHGDHLVVEHRDRAVITQPLETGERPAPWLSLLGVTGVISLIALGWLRMSGTVPLQPEVVDLHRAHALRWRYRRRTVHQHTPIDTDGARRLETIGDVVRLGERTHRPVVTDPRGTVAVNVDEATYAWWPGGSA